MLCYVSSQVGWHQVTPDLSTGGRVLTTMWVLGVAPCLEGYACQASGQKHRASRSWGRRNTSVFFPQNHFFLVISSMVPEVHEWTASVSFLRQFDIIQGTLQGMWTFLMSEDLKLQLPSVQMGGSGSVYTNNITLHIQPWRERFSAFISPCT